MKIRRFDSIAAFETAFEDLLRLALTAAHPAPFAVFISGGKTPLAVYNRIAQHPFAPARNAFLAFADERHVPDDSPDSNLSGARAMIAALGIQDRLLRPDTTISLEESAQNFDAALRRFLDDGGEIPLAVLGLGADGHTCSLFTQHDLERAAGHLAIPVTRPAPPHRVSTTPALLEHARRIVFTVTGPDKEDIFAQLQSHPESVIAGRATARCSNVEFWRA